MDHHETLTQRKICEIADVLRFARKLIANLEQYMSVAAEVFPELSINQVADKLLAETALLLLVCHRLPGECKLSELALSIANLMEPRVRTARLLSLLTESPQVVAGLALPHVALSLMGIVDDVFDDAIVAACESPSLCAVDRPNFRHLEIEWLLGLFQKKQPDFQTLVQASLLQRRLHPIFLRREDGYAMTHTIMYLTDFGMSALPASINQGDVHYFVDHGIAWCLAEYDWDLMIEIMLCEVIVPRPQSSFFDAADLTVQRMFAEQGKIYWERYNRDGTAVCENEEPLSDLYAYHSTFLYGILRAVELVKNRPVNCSIEPISEEVLFNGKLIAMARSNNYPDLLPHLTAGYQLDARLSETCSVACEKLMQHVRAESYRRWRTDNGQRQ